MKDLTALTAHIEALNAKMDGPFSVAPAAHFSEFYGITTVEEFEYHMALENYVNAYKEWAGFKPRGMREMTLEELEKETEQLYGWVQQEIDREATYMMNEKARQEAWKKAEDHAWKQATTKPVGLGTALSDALSAAK